MAHIEAATETASRPRGIFGHLYVWVLIAIVAGGLIGHFNPTLGVALKPLADNFIKAVKMVIAPVIFFTIATGIAGMRDMGRLGGVTAKAFAYFLTFSTLALVVGLVVGNVWRPGDGFPNVASADDLKQVEGYVEKSHDMSVVGFLSGIIPDTAVGAFSSGQLLPVLFISILFGVALALSGDRGKPVADMLDATGAVFFRMVGLIMWAAPIGAFGAFAFTIGRYGAQALVDLAELVAAVYLTSAAFIFGVLGLVAAAAGFSIIKLLVYLRVELLLVLGTSSSESALPALMEKLEKAGCARPVVGLVVPTGYSFNLDGTNIYMTLAALFIAQATNTPLTLAEQAYLLAIAMISSKGAAGVTGAGFITLAATLQVVPTIPLAGMALILGVDRFMSECRSITNFIGNAVATLVVSRWDNSLDRERLKQALSGRLASSASIPVNVDRPAD